MQKRLRYMRGPEDVHNFLIHKQYGIVATGGGRLRWIHLDMIRLAIARFIDPSRMFAVWRVDPPWQPVTRKGQGMRMGGGKGAIDHYVTPIKAGRVIVELAGKLEYEEVRQFLTNLASMLPFDAKAISQQELEKEEEAVRELESRNINRHTWKYIIQNNMGGCRLEMKPIDMKYFRKHV